MCVWFYVLWCETLFTCKYCTHWYLYCRWLAPAKSWCFCICKPTWNKSYLVLSCLVWSDLIYLISSYLILCTVVSNKVISQHQPQWFNNILNHFYMILNKWLRFDMDCANPMNRNQPKITDSVCCVGFLGILLLTWINFIPMMDK